MNRLRSQLNSRAVSAWNALPTALWVYFAALTISVVVAAEFSTLTFHLTALSIAIYVILLAGLLRGSRLCRWLLTLWTASTAFGLLAIQAGELHFADLCLVVVVMAQVVVLCAPPVRSFASHHH
jgi:hypothetical protein